LHARGLSRFVGKYFSSLELKINYFLNVDSGVVGLCLLLVLSEFGVLVGVPRGAESRSGLGTSHPALDDMLIRHLSAATIM